MDDAFATTTGETTLTAGLLDGDKVMPPLPGSPSAPEGKAPGDIPTAAQVEEIPDEDDAVCETAAVRGVSGSSPNLSRSRCVCLYTSFHFEQTSTASTPLGSRN